jgi:hypothetical protein
VAQQLVHQRDGEAGLAGAGRHGEQDVALAGRDGAFDRDDGVLLVGPQPRDTELAVGGRAQVLSDLLQAFGQVARREPLGQGAGLAAGRPRVPEPDARLGRELLHVGAAVGDEQEGDTEAVEARRPRAAGQGLVRDELDAARVALGLTESPRHVRDAALGLDHADAAAVDEQRVVDRAAIGRPLGDRDRLARLRARASGVAQHGAVDDPADRAELVVDQDARGRLVELDLVGLLARDLGEQVELLRGRGPGRRLGCFEGALGLSQAGFRLGGVALPEFAVALLRQSTDLGLLVSERDLRRGVGAGLRLVAQLLHFRLERRGSIDRRNRRNERARLEPGGAAVAAVEPDRCLARDLEPGQRLAGRAGVFVRGRVAQALEVEEQTGDLVRQDRLQPEGAQHVVEAGGVRGQQPVARRDLLGDELAKLAKLDQRPRRVVEKIALGQRAQAGEALVVRRQEGKVADTSIGRNLPACP